MEDGWKEFEKEKPKGFSYVIVQRSDGSVCHGYYQSCDKHGNRNSFSSEHGNLFFSDVVLWQPFPEARKI